LVLSPKLREKNGITNEAFFIASGDTFQIWAPDRYEATMASTDAWYDDFGEDFDPLTLLDAPGSGG
jgi:MraZ protein